VLYVEGKLPPMDEKLSIAIVGTRESTPDGMWIARNLSMDLAKNDVIVVSGGAVGIDRAAHEGAMGQGGKTVCVLGCGIRYHYLMKNEKMRRNITQSGALVSEYPMDGDSKAWHFPERNRIISALSDGTVVVEAGYKSGALITADYAKEQNRDLFAVPGSILQPSSYGTNDLIKDGAIPVTTAEDILDEYRYRYGYLRQSERRYLAPFQILRQCRTKEVQLNWKDLPEEDDVAPIREGWRSRIQRITEERKGGVFYENDPKPPEKPKKTRGGEIAQICPRPLSYLGEEIEEAPSVSTTAAAAKVTKRKLRLKSRIKADDRCETTKPVEAESPEPLSLVLDTELDMEWTPNDERLFSLMTKEPQQLSKLQSQMGVPVQAVLVSLSNLELAGKIKCLPGSRYCLL
jgi:DNA protecting protein DprA